MLLYDSFTIALRYSVKLAFRQFARVSFELLPHPPYTPDLAPSNYWLFADLKKILQGKRFDSNEEVAAETEAYFESKDESFCKKGIEKLEKRWNEYITLEGNYVVLYFQNLSSSVM